MGKKINNQYINFDDYYILRIHSNKYGTFDFKIDNDLVEKCKLYHWSVNKYKSSITDNGYFYATNSKMGFLHRFVIDAPKGKIVDHINGDTCDTRLGNLQICSTQDNIRKSKIARNNTSGVKGVLWNKHIPTPKWMAYIMVNKKFINLGYFEDFEVAVNVRKEAEKKYFGDFLPIE